MSATLFTIGYQGAKVEQVVASLAAAQVSVLVDTRETPMSRRVEFRQKRQDFLIRAIAQHRARLAGYRFVIVGDGPDLPKLRERARFGIAAQTTQPIEKVRYLVGLIRWRFPASEVRFVDTVCRPTKQRQHAAVELAQQSDVVVVIGGAQSNNTHELVKTCARFCGQVYHVQTAADLRSEWFAGAGTVGITAGTSTPDSEIAAVEQWLAKLAESLAPVNGSEVSESLHPLPDLKAA